MTRHSNLYDKLDFHNNRNATSLLYNSNNDGDLSIDSIGIQKHKNTGQKTVFSTRSSSNSSNSTSALSNIFERYRPFEICMSSSNALLYPYLLKVVFPIHTQRETNLEQNIYTGIDIEGKVKGQGNPKINRRAVIDSSKAENEKDIPDKRKRRSKYSAYDNKHYRVGYTFQNGITLNKLILKEKQKLNLLLKTMVAYIFDSSEVNLNSRNFQVCLTKPIDNNINFHHNESHFVSMEKLLQILIDKLYFRSIEHFHETFRNILARCWEDKEDTKLMPVNSIGNQDESEFKLILSRKQFIFHKFFLSEKDNKFFSSSTTSFLDKYKDSCDERLEDNEGLERTLTFMKEVDAMHLYRERKTLDDYGNEAFSEFINLPRVKKIQGQIAASYNSKDMMRNSKFSSNGSDVNSNQHGDSSECPNRKDRQDHRQLDDKYPVITVGPPPSKYQGEKCKSSDISSSSVKDEMIMDNFALHLHYLDILLAKKRPESCSAKQQFDEFQPVSDKFVNKFSSEVKFLQNEFSNTLLSGLREDKIMIDDLPKMKKLRVAKKEDPRLRINSKDLKKPKVVKRSSRLATEQINAMLNNKNTKNISEGTKSISLKKSKHRISESNKAKAIVGPSSTSALSSQNELPLERRKSLLKVKDTQLFSEIEKHNSKKMTISENIVEENNNADNVKGTKGYQILKLYNHFRDIPGIHYQDEIDNDDYDLSDVSLDDDI